MQTDPDRLPTARSTLAARYVRILLACRSCLRQRDADLQHLVDAGRGDIPLVNLRWRCAHCGGRRIDLVASGSSAAPFTWPENHFGPHGSTNAKSGPRDVPGAASSDERLQSVDQASLHTPSVTKPCQQQPLVNKTDGDFQLGSAVNERSASEVPTSCQRPGPGGTLSGTPRDRDQHSTE